MKLWVVAPEAGRSTCGRVCSGEACQGRTHRGRRAHAHAHPPLTLSRLGELSLNHWLRPGAG